MTQSAAHPTQPPARTGSLALLGALLAFAIAALLPASAFADTSFGESGTGAGQLRFPHGVAVSRQSGDVYVADEANLRIDEFTASGGFVRAFGWGVLNGATELQTCTTATGCQSGLEGSGTGQLDFPTGVAIDNDPASPSYGDVWAADRPNLRIEKFTAGGQFLLTLGGKVNKTAGLEGRTGEENICPAPGHPNDECQAGVAGSGAGEFKSVEGIKNLATGPEGKLYVGDLGRVDQFEQDGAPIGTGSFPLQSATIPVRAIAVDTACAQQEPPLAGPGCTSFDSADGDIYVHQALGEEELAGVQPYDASGAFTGAARELDTKAENPTSRPVALAVNGSGDVFIGDFNQEHGSEFRGYHPDGTLFAVATSPFLSALPAGIAVGDAAQKIYAATFLPSDHVAVVDEPQPGPPRVSGLGVTDLEPTTATLHAIVNPEQFNTTYQFQYITQRKYEEDGSSFGAGTVKKPEPPAGLGSVSREDKVAAAISDLSVATAYRWRVVAENECNGPSPTAPCVASSEASFETLPAVSIRELTTQLVGPEEVELTAELNGNNSLTKTHWKICLGTEAGAEPGDYSLGCREGELQAGSSAFEAIEATFTGLQPNTTYHYKLFAENENTSPGHPEESADQTLETELSAAEERAAEASCSNGHPNSTLREQNNSTRLPDCRAYEQVSPVDKGGHAIIYTLGSLGGESANQLSPSGERDRFISDGAFAGTTEMASLLGTEYVAHRTPSGWLTEPTLSSFAGPDAFSLMWGLNAELSSWLIQSVPKPQAGPSPTEAAEMTLFQHEADGSLAPVSPPLRSAEGKNEEFYSRGPIAQSADFSRIFINASYPLLPTDPRPYDHDNRGNNRIYEVSGAGGPSPTLSLVAEVPTDLTNGSCELDQNTRSGDWTSADGATFLYTQPLDLSHGQPCEGQANPQELFARFDGAAPIELSAESPSQCTPTSPCDTAAPSSVEYDGVSPDGKLAWFTTAQPLIDSDTDTTDDLYLAKLEGGQLTGLVQASAGEANLDHPTPGQGAGVQGVLKPSPDGSRIAFVATGVLTTNPNPTTGQSAAAGADNLYVYDAASEELKFVARLCSAPEDSGSIGDSACPQPVEPNNYSGDRVLWEGGTQREAQLTPDGRYLLFASYGRLTADDTDRALDVYRYDFQSGQLIRLSVGHRGNDADGNDSAFPAQVPANAITRGVLNGIAEDAGRAISADGSTVIFETTAPLVSRDTNAGNAPGCGARENGCDVYQWSEDGHGTCAEPGGCVSLISDGKLAQGASVAVISSSGRDITFVTSAGLTPADTDGVPDVYDARAGGGFPYTTPPVPCGAAEICHGPVPPEPTPPKITSGGETGGNGPPQLKCGKGRHRVTKHGQVRCVAKKHHKAKHHKKHKRANTNRRAGK